MRIEVDRTAEICARTQETFAPASTPDQSHLFAIISWGAAPSARLAQAINSHPDIFCVKAWNETLRNFEPSVRLEPVDYAAFLLRAGFGWQAVGDVDGLSKDGVLAIRNTFGPGFSAVSVVGHPRTTLKTYLTDFETFRQHTDLAGLDHQLRQRIDNGDVVLPDTRPETLLFARAVNMLNVINWAPRAGPIFRIEDLSRRPNTLAGLVAYLSGGRVVPDERWLRVVSREQHLTGPRSVDKFVGWQVEVIGSVLLPWTWSLYERLGYELPGRPNGERVFREPRLKRSPGER